MTAARLLVVFVFYVAALDLVRGAGLVGAVASPPGLAMLVGAGILLAWSAVRAARTPAPPALRAARVLLRAGGALFLVAAPANLAVRDGTTVSAGEGESLPAGDGMPALRFGEVTLAPRGPYLLSKTVEIEALAPDGGDVPLRIGLFPTTALGGRRLSVFRFGYAPGVTLVGQGGARVVEGYVKLGTFPQSAETASLVEWTPETNLMMGAGTFPPRLEDLVSPPRSGLHVFLRLVEATLGGARRDLMDPNAHRWLLDGRPERAVFFVQVFRGRERLYEGRLRAGEGVRFPGGALDLWPDVALWVDLLATRDPFLPEAGIGLALLCVGAVLRGAVGAARLVRSRARRA